MCIPRIYFLTFKMLQMNQPQNKDLPKFRLGNRFKVRKKRSRKRKANAMIKEIVAQYLNMPPTKQLVMK